MFSFLVRLLRWRMGYSGEAEQPRPAAEPYVPQYAVPDIEKIAHPDPSDIQVTWVGHSTFLIQAAGVNILTDPIWSERASPFTFAGPKRQAKPGVDFTDLPKIDAVLISHTHYDHLDRPTIKKLGPSLRYVMPPHVAAWFARLDIVNTIELPWWSATTAGTIKITAVPAKHWSKRNYFGTGNAGWGGYILETPSGTIYFAGDTGYYPEYFKEIGERFPNILLGLIPIGAYYPKWIFGRYHVDPGEAIAIHKEIRAKYSIGMHWGTFKLTEEPLDEPPQLLQKEAAAANLPPEAFTTMKIGETRGLK